MFTSLQFPMFFNLYCLSAGPPVTFALDVSPLRILPPAGFIRAPNGSFRAVLALDQPADNTVDITCSLDAVPSWVELSNTSELCSSPLTEKVTLANSSVEIELSETEIQFQVGYTIILQKLKKMRTNSKQGR